MAPNFSKIFISYRRDGGSEMASLIASSLLKRKKWIVFFDVKTLEAGRFDSAILQNLVESKHFLLVLTKGALDRCIEDKNRKTMKDWVHKEIVAALKMKLNIILLLHPDFKWPPAGDLPENMRDISRFNGIPWSHPFQEAAIDKIEKFIEKTSDKRDKPHHNNDSYDEYDYLKIYLKLFLLRITIVVTIIVVIKLIFNFFFIIPYFMFAKDDETSST